MHLADEILLASPHYGFGDRLLIRATGNVLRVVIRTELDQVGHSPLQQASVRLLIRIASSFRTCWRVIGAVEDSAQFENMTNDLAALARCMHDAMIQLKYMLAGDQTRNLSPVELGGLYCNFEHIERFNAINGLQKLGGPLARHISSSPLASTGNAAAEDRYKQVCPVYSEGRSKRIRRTWYPGTLRELAKQTGLEDEHFFFTSLSNSSIHSGPLATSAGSPIFSGPQSLIVLVSIASRSAKLVVDHFGLALSVSVAEQLEQLQSDITGVRPHGFEISASPTDPTLGE